MPQPPLPRTLLAPALALTLSLALLCPASSPRAVAEDLPRSFSDRAFWSMVSTFSEPPGFFRSDNLVSNETTFQEVIPALRRIASPGGVYLGVGPEQNFTYLVALEPRLAFIVDIRRQNLVLHLLYKALAELSEDRSQFLSLLFSRPRPPDVDRQTTVQALFEAQARMEPSRGLFERNLRLVLDLLTRRRGFPLTDEDREMLQVVYEAFFTAGPDLTYSFRTASSTYGAFPSYWRRFPTYAELMTASDGLGTPRSYLATEQSFQALRALHRRNVIVPVVGDFAGRKALAAIGRYLRRHKSTVTAFYTSNVEQYLFRGEGWRHFFANVAALPTDSRSVFIRAHFLYGPRPPSANPHQRSTTLLCSIPDLIQAHRNGRIQSYADVIDFSHLSEPEPVR